MIGGDCVRFRGSQDAEMPWLRGIANSGPHDRRDGSRSPEVCGSEKDSPVRVNVALDWIPLRQDQ